MFAPPGMESAISSNRLEGNSMPYWPFALQLMFFHMEAEGAVNILLVYDPLV